MVSQEQRLAATREMTIQRLAEIQAKLADPGFSLEKAAAELRTAIFWIGVGWSPGNHLDAALRALEVSVGGDMNMLNELEARLAAVEIAASKETK